MRSFIFGNTRSGLPIPAYQFGSGSDPKILILGGVHGDEIEGVIAAQGLLRNFANDFSYRLSVTLVPMFNLDGVLNKSRTNSARVDLNRNLPTNDWTADVPEVRYYPGPRAGSEPENQALVEFLSLQRPALIYSLHSWHPMLNINGACKREAEEIARWTGYEVKESIGYPTPGCLGTYAGLEREMPTLTYEIERGLEASEILRVHVPAISESLKLREARS
jgi:protein MpaA